MIDPTNLDECRALAQRLVGEYKAWTTEDWNAQLIGDSVVRTMNGAFQTFYRPHKSAQVFLLRPRVTARTEGDVSEQYGDLTATVQNLREMDAEWVAARIPPEATSAETWDGTITWGGW